MRRLLSSLIMSTACIVALSISYGAPGSGAQQGGAGAAAGQAAPAANVEKAGESKQFTNIQVLKDIPADQVIPSMQFITGALGVDCSFCHVTDKGHEGYASDEKPNKKTAREMMTMTMGINKENFQGQQRVTCATCHNGHNNPNPVAPVLDDVRWQERVDARARQQARTQQPAAAGANAAQGTPAAGQQPGRMTPQQMQAAADEIFAKYEQAIGGEAAVQKLTSIDEKGTITTPHGDKSDYELKRKAPDKIAFTRSLPNGGAQNVVYDGSSAGARFGNQTQAIHGFELGALKLDANFFRNINPKAQYARVQALPFTQKIDGKEVRVVRGILPNSQGQDTLYFDNNTGLLVRRVTVLRTALGGIPQQVDFSEYRDVNGVKVAFTSKVSGTDNIQTRTISDIKFNAPMDDSAFKVPTAGAAPGGER